MIDEFIKRLMIKLNTLIPAYYEEAPKSASFPYAVIPAIVATNLKYGFQCLFDVELHTNELSNVNLEQKCDLLINALDDYSEQNDKCGFHIGFDDCSLNRQNEQDLSMRKLTFIARIF